MKITVYTTSECQFSKQEKDYLAANSLTYEEKSLDSNKDFLTEMLAVSSNFAGTPVTRVEKDDGQIIVLKGFTKEEFDTALNLVPPSVAPPKVQAPMPNQPVAVPTPAPVPIAPTVTPPANLQLDSLLNDLQAQANPPPVPPAPVVPPPVPPMPPAPPVAASLPKIPDPNFNG